MHVNIGLEATITLKTTHFKAKIAWPTDQIGPAQTSLASENYRRCIPDNKGQGKQLRQLCAHQTSM